jgi:hypothetical protein
VASCVVMVVPVRVWLIGLLRLIECGLLWLLLAVG